MSRDFITIQLADKEIVRPPVSVLAQEVEDPPVQSRLDGSDVDHLDLFGQIVSSVCSKFSWEERSSRVMVFAGQLGPWDTLKNAPGPNDAALKEWVAQHGQGSERTFERHEPAVKGGGPR
jgi:hypothetical protein